MSLNKVMVAGHICLDITPKFPDGITGGFSDIFSPGKLINVGDSVLSTGGAVSNTGLALAKLGLDVQLNGKIGNDEFGGIILDLVGRERGSSFSIVEGQSTSYSIVLAIPGIDRVFLHHTGTNDTFVSDDVDYEVLKKCAVFHFGYPTLMKKMYSDNGSELVKLLKRVKELGVVTSLDMTIPDPESESGQVDWAVILENILPYVDIFLPSVEEIAFMLDQDLFNKRKQQAQGNDPVEVYSAGDCEYLSNKLIDAGVKIVAIKNGIKGYYLQTADKDKMESLTAALDIDLWSSRQMWAPSYRCDSFASATGAGDATIAGFLFAVMRGVSPVDALHIANTVGWQNVRGVDSLSTIEDWETTLEMAADKSRVRNPLLIEDDGWAMSQDDMLYYGPLDKR